MASAAQIVANRSNAQRSTGPRTPEGKAVVAQNAVRHGLLAQRVVIKGEDPGEFELVRERMLEDLDPVGSVETMLAERVVNLGWRLQRAARFESAAWATLEADQAAKATAQPAAFLRTKGIGQPEREGQGDEESIFGRVVVKDFGDAKVLDQLLVYERRIENSLYRTMAELRKQRLLRDLETAEETSRSEYRLQAGQESVASAVRTPPDGKTPNTRVDAVLPTTPETPCGPGSSPGQAPPAKAGVTTNGAQREDELCQTKPIEVAGLEDQEPCAQTQELGRGRPSHEGASRDATTNGVELAHHSNIPSCQHSSLCQACQTKPNEVSGEQSQSTDAAGGAGEPGRGPT